MHALGALNPRLAPLALLEVMSAAEGWLVRGEEVLKRWAAGWRGLVHHGAGGGEGWREGSVVYTQWFICGQMCKKLLIIALLRYVHIHGQHWMERKEGGREGDSGC